MKIIEPSAEILYITKPEDIQFRYKQIETAGRTCYKSESKADPNDSGTFVSRLVNRGHKAMIEHASMTVRFIVDRGVSHEIVRHRLASFAQESTRYCNYSQDKFGNEITIIRPFFLKENTAPYDAWIKSCQTAENMYMLMLAFGCTPEEARCVLPTCLKTELIMTANMREWRHFFQLRAVGVTGKPHPQMAQVAVPLMNKCKELMPEIFGDMDAPILSVD